MVERPIKKSERQSVAPSSDVDESVKGKRRPNEERLDSTSERSFQKKDKTKRKGKGNQEDSRSTSVNPALVRAKKPTKPKPPALEQTLEPTSEDAVEPTSEDSVTETTQVSTASE